MSIQSTREGLASTLTTAVSFKVHPHLPERLSEPSGFIIPGAPYLVPDVTFGSFIIRLEAHLVFQGVNNEAASNGIDSAVEDAVVAAVNAGWAVESVSEPFELTLSGTSFLAVQMQVTKAITL